MNTITTYELIEKSNLYSTIINNELYGSLDEIKIIPAYIDSDIGNIRIKLVEVVNFIIKELHLLDYYNIKTVIFKLLLEHLISLDSLFVVTDINDIDKFEVNEILGDVSYNIILDLVNLKVGDIHTGTDFDELLKQELISVVISEHYIDFCNKMYSLSNELLEDNGSVEIGPLVYKIVYNVNIAEQRCFISLCYGISTEEENDTY